MCGVRKRQRVSRRGAAAAGIETGTGTNLLGWTRIDEWLTWRSAGASAATIATVLTHPFDAVKVRTSACQIEPSAEDGDEC